MFEDTHALVLAAAGRAGRRPARRSSATVWPTPPATWSACGSRGRRVWVEKILDPGERLRDWPVSGTVGYEFSTMSARCSSIRPARGALTALWQEISGDHRSFAEVALEAKLEQARRTLLARARAARARAGARRRLASRARALGLAVASLPVYRTYVDANAGTRYRRGSCRDRRRHDGTRDRGDAAAGAPGAAGVRHALSADHAGAVMAKGVEDTAFYRYGRLLALNDVGGDPAASVSAWTASTAGMLERSRAVSAQPADHANARRQALGGRARTHRRAGVDARGMGHTRAALARAH